MACRHSAASATHHEYGQVAARWNRYPFRGWGRQVRDRGIVVSPFGPPRHSGKIRARCEWRGSVVVADSCAVADRWRSGSGVEFGAQQVQVAQYPAQRMVGASPATVGRLCSAAAASPASETVPSVIRSSRSAVRSSSSQSHTSARSSAASAGAVEATESACSPAMSPPGAALSRSSVSVGVGRGRAAPAHTAR